MSTITQVKRCFVCGKKLQDEKEDQPGYISPEVFHSYGPGSVLLCNSCFRGSRYNIVPRAPVVNEEWLSMVQDAKASDSLVVYVIDLFSFEASFPMELVSLLEGAKLLILANKRDLLDPKYPDEEIKEYVAHRFRASKLSATKNDVILASLTSMSDVSRIAEEIEKRREYRDVYLIGSSMAGKSAFRDAYLRKFFNHSNQPIVTTFYPKTQIPVMAIPLDASTKLYDAPGIPLTNDIRGLVPLSTLKRITPNKPLLGEKFILGREGFISIEGLAMFGLVDGKKTPVTVFCKPELHIHIHHSRPAINSFFKRIEEKRVKVYDPKFSHPSDFDAFDIKVEEEGERDIGIEGLGWFRFNGNGQTFTTLVPKGVSVYTSRAKIKKKHAK